MVLGTEYMQEYQSAERAYMQGQYEDAATLIDQLAEQYPEDLNVRLLKGHIYCYGLHRYDVAVDQYQSVLGLTAEPEYVEYATNGLAFAEEQVNAGIGIDSSGYAQDDLEALDGSDSQDYLDETVRESWDPDTARIWWQDVGVHQNLTHAVQPDPISGAHCWLQKATSVRKAEDGDQYGDVWVDTEKSMEVYRRWVALTRSAVDNSPDGTRRPMWLKRPLKPTAEAYKLPENS